MVIRNADQTHSGNTIGEILRSKGMAVVEVAAAVEPRKGYVIFNADSLRTLLRLNGEIVFSIMTAWVDTDGTVKVDKTRVDASLNRFGAIDKETYIKLEHMYGLCCIYGYKVVGNIIDIHDELAKEINLRRIK